MVTGGHDDDGGDGDDFVAEGQKRQMPRLGDSRKRRLSSQTPSNFTRPSRLERSATLTPASREWHADAERTYRVHLATHCVADAARGAGGARHGIH